jgi:cell division initiation protein
MSKPEEMAQTTSEPRLRITSPERNISVTPLEMRQARFTAAFRGYDKADVTSFLQEAAEGFDQAMRENERLRMEIVRLEASLHQFRELEGSLQTTLVNAQKIADDVRDNARQEAQRIVREAEGRAELMLQKAQAKTEDIEREIDGLRIKRREAETNLEATISALHNTLDFIREQDGREREDRVVQHWPKAATTRPA